MIKFRAYSRLIAIVGWSLLFAVPRLTVYPLRLLDPGLEYRCWRALFMAWGRGVTRILGMKIELRGTPATPPFFLVSNHVSMMDVFLLASQLGCIFVSRADLADWPVFGFLARQGGTLFIDRQNRLDTVRVNGEISEALRAGHGVAVFAEGGVSVDAQVRDFKPALLEPAVRAGLPVHYASVHYAMENGQPGALESIVWGADMGLFGHFFRVAGLPGFKAILTLGETPIASADRKQLADSLCNAVRESFIPLY